MSPSAVPGEADPVDVDGSSLPWKRLAHSSPKGNPRPKLDDLWHHEQGFVPEEEEALREAARQMLRDAVAGGMSAAKAKVAIVVGATVELGAIRSRIEKVHHERRVAAHQESA